MCSESYLTAGTCIVVFFNIVILVGIVVAIAEYPKSIQVFKNESFCRLCCKVAVAVLTAEGEPAVLSSCHRTL